MGVKRPATSESESEAVDNSEEESVEEKPVAKKAKKEKSKKVVPRKAVTKPREGSSEGEGSGSVQVQTNEQGEKYASLGGKKRITVRSFKGKAMVDIREFYQKDGKELPGSKGISLSADQWEKLKGSMEEIDTLFKSLN